MTYQPRIDAENDLRRWAPIILLTAMALIAVYLFSKDGPKPPAKASAFGCYISNNRPSILIDVGGLKVVGSSMEPVPFKLEWHDEGVTLWPEKRLVLTDGPLGGSFKIENEAGHAFTFVNVFNGGVYPDVDATELETFQIFTASGSRAAFRKVNPARCVPPNEQ